MALCMDQKAKKITASTVKMIGMPAKTRIFPRIPNPRLGRRKSSDDKDAREDRERDSRASGWVIGMAVYGSSGAGGKGKGGFQFFDAATKRARFQAGHDAGIEKNGIEEFGHVIIRSHSNALGAGTGDAGGLGIGDKHTYQARAAASASRRSNAAAASSRSAWVLVSVTATRNMLGHCGVEASIINPAENAVLAAKEVEDGSGGNEIHHLINAPRPDRLEHGGSIVRRMGVKSQEALRAFRSGVSLGVACHFSSIHIFTKPQEESVGDSR
jgi:hypothetical protein